jgi:hypothetical protein
MLKIVWQWISTHEQLLFWLGLFSIITFIVTTFIVPLFIILLPYDYFTNEEKIRRFYKMSPVLLLMLMVLKNILGIIFILTGVVLLVLPGQGLLTILLGVLLLDFPYKRTVELKVIGEAHVLSGINWIRKKFGKEPLLVPKPDK